MKKKAKQSKPLLSRGERIFDIVNVTLCCILIVIFLYPFWDTLILSVSDVIDAKQMGIRLLPKLPLHFDSYERVFEQPLFLTALQNSIFRTVVGTIFSVLITFSGAYVMAKRRLPGQKFITMFVLFTMFFNGGTIPTYLMIKELGMLDTVWVWLLPGMTSAWFLIIARNFIASIPDAIEEAAMIDGAGVLNTMFRVIFPMSKPIIAVIALWAAIGQWNSWYDAYIYTRSEDLMVLQLLLRRIIIEDSRDVMGKALTESSALTTPETVKAAIIVVTMVPIACIYPFFQKHFVKGIQVGAVKG